MVSAEVYAVHLHLVVLVDVYVHNGLVGAGEVVDSFDAYFGVAEAFVGVVALDNRCGAVYDILCYLVAAHQLQAFLQILDFAFLCAVVVDCRYAGLSAQDNLEPCAVADGFGEFDTCLGEEGLPHEALDRIGDIIAGDGYPLAFVQSRIAENQEIVVVGSSFHFYAGDFVCPWHGGIQYRRVEYSVG